MTELLAWHRSQQFVVCVNATRPNVGPDPRRLLELGAVYRVRHAFIDPHYDEAFLLLEEIRNTERAWMLGTYEPGYPATAFRPARDTSIESLRALLNPLPEARREVFKEMIAEATHG